MIEYDEFLVTETEVEGKCYKFNSMDDDDDDYVYFSVFFDIDYEFETDEDFKPYKVFFIKGEPTITNDVKLTQKEINEIKIIVNQKITDLL
jgi:hypothetical protein